MKKVIELLDLSTPDYETLLFETYFNWCTDFCSNYQDDLQSLVANRALNKYFLQEYNKLEEEFLQLASRYENNINITSVHYRELYADCTVKIFNRFSKVLIKKAKQNTITNYERN
ncbi:hypothetical protein [Flavobacterium covae]|uniref:hypothetical protein n=1 Tax=Flavobacterium covae TaxID=2906076 RepID=UPI000745E671|nr:hypothetical protein [Flavobacterium covae]AMA49435.1 hypothetical protein AWN65_08180 [Flavobacterium covae]MCJ1808958.1 hypothetical protein [Flavobacterium covae]